MDLSPPRLSPRTTRLCSGEDHVALLCRSGVTIPGNVCFLPTDVPERIAEVVVDAVAAVGG